MINLRRPFALFCYLLRHYPVYKIADGEKVCARCGVKLDKYGRPRP